MSLTVAIVQRVKMMTTTAATARTRRPRVRPLHPDELRVAAIDVGSNSIHMVVAQVDASGGISILWRMREMVGLGRISFPSKRLTKLAMDRATMTLRRFMMEAQRWHCEDVVAVATSAVREAENGGEFIERVLRELGVHVRVVSARDEARLIYLGVRHARDLRGGPNFIFDIGGGSVEFIVADATDKPALLESRKLGAARVTARYLKSDPPEPKEVKALLAHYDEELTTVLESVRQLKPRRFIGTSGAILNLAAMSARNRDAGGDDDGDGQPKPLTLSRDRLDRTVQSLLKSTADERAAMPGLDEKRKEQIVAAALLVQHVFEKARPSRRWRCATRRYAKESSWTTSRVTAPSWRSAARRRNRGGGRCWTSAGDITGSASTPSRSRGCACDCSTSSARCTG